VEQLPEARTKRLIKKWWRTGDLTIRDELFKLSFEEISRYVKYSLKKYKRYESEAQILSLSYDIFTKALDTYKVDSKTSLSAHFGNCVRIGMRKFTKREIPMEQLDADNPDLIDNPFYAAEGFITLKDFREFLPDMYRNVLDDAISSFDNARKFKRTRPQDFPLSYHRYYEAKRVFQYVVDFFIRG